MIFAHGAKDAKNLVAQTLGFRQPAAQFVDQGAGMRVTRDWFKARLRELGKTQNDLAAALETSPTTVSRLLDKTRPIKAAEIAQLAGVLAVPPATLYAYFGLEPEDAKRMPLDGFIYENGVVRPELDASAPELRRFRHIAEVMRPTDFRGDHAFLIVETAGLPNFEAGDVLYCMAAPGGKLEAFNGRECVVTLRGGQRFLRRIQRIGATDRWVLVSRSGEVMTDARIMDALAVTMLWHAGLAEG